MRKKLLVLTVSPLLLLTGMATAQAQAPVNPSTIDRSQVLADKEEALRKSIVSTPTIRKIEVSGVNKELAPEVKDAVKPYKDKPMTDENINGVVEAVKKVYADHNMSSSLSSVTPRTKRTVLSVKVVEK
ncbi:MAG: POTRA domain-containing protein [Deltaproteobacteria bacterium]